MAYFFDASAIIEFAENPGSMEMFLEETIFTNTLHICEVHFYFLKKHNKQTANYWVQNLNMEIIDIEVKIATEASLFKFENLKKNLSYADCIGYISAIGNGLTFLTADTAFAKFNGVEIISVED